MQIDLTDEDVDELRRAVSVYREHMIRMAGLMDDTRYLNSLPWMQVFEARLAEVKGAAA